MDHSIDSDRIVLYHANLLKTKSMKITEEIISNHHKTTEERNKLLRKISADIIGNNLLGNATNSKVIDKLLIEFIYIIN